MKIYDVIILGAGASGLMCAANLPSKKTVALLDVNEKVAKKLKISGGGKCNVTNANVSLENFDGDKELIDYALKKFSKDDLLKFLDRNGVPLELRKNRYYFCQNSSDEIINALKRGAKNAELTLNGEILEVVKREDVFEVKTSKGVLNARNVVVATGGKSYTTLGASEVGLEIAKSFGLKVKSFTSACSFS